MYIIQKRNFFIFVNTCNTIMMKMINSESFRNEIETKAFKPFQPFSVRIVPCKPFRSPFKPFHANRSPFRSPFCSPFQSFHANHSAFHWCSSYTSGSVYPVWIDTAVPEQSWHLSSTGLIKHIEQARLQTHWQIKQWASVKHQCPTSSRREHKYQTLSPNSKKKIK
jgi:hypothetical protein